MAFESCHLLIELDTEARKGKSIGLIEVIDQVFPCLCNEERKQDRRKVWVQFLDIRGWDKTAQVVQSPFEIEKSPEIVSSNNLSIIYKSRKKLDFGHKWEYMYCYSTSLEQQIGAGLPLSSWSTLSHMIGSELSQWQGQTEPHQETLTGTARYLDNRGKHPTGRAGGCISKLQVLEPQALIWGAIFAHRHSAWLPMYLVMGPGRHVEARSRCYKYLRVWLCRCIVMRRFLCVVCIWRELYASVCSGWNSFILTCLWHCL